MSQNSYTATQMWERFIERLNAVDPLIFKRDEPALPHKSFLGSIERYRAIFMEANKEQPLPESGLQWKEVEGYEGVLQESGKVGAQKVWPGDAVFCINDFKFYVLTLPSLPDATGGE